MTVTNTGSTVSDVVVLGFLSKTENAEGDQDVDSLYVDTDVWTGAAPCSLLTFSATDCVRRSVRML